MEQLYVGVGREDITPAIGDLLQGYTPPRAATTIHDNLHVTAFAFVCGDVRALLLSADLANIRYPQEKVREILSQATGVPTEYIVLACTHTHSGALTNWENAGALNPYIPETFIPAAVRGAETAMASLRPAQMGIGTTLSDVGVNKRQIKEDGTVILGQNPYGSRDPVMTVVAFREPDGTPIGNLIHYGCHNTASGNNGTVTRDWCGVAVDRLEQQSGGITAFVNGCAGDVGPRLPDGKTVGTVAQAQELGGMAAVDAVRAWRSIKRWENVPLKVLQDNIRIPLEKVGTEADTVAKAMALGDFTTLKGTMVTSYQRLVQRADFIRQGNTPPAFKDVPHTFIALGPLVLQAMPFEIFSIITLRIREGSPFAHTLCMGYCNGTQSYFPSMDQMLRGGYEVRICKTCNLFPIADDAEQAYVTGSLELLRKLYEQ